VATDLIEINSDKPDADAIDRAVASIRQGKVVAIPTDARYSLVADPYNLRAVQQVFYV
jgi:L-threonylcarbamoyladenylate synthase